MFSSYTGFPYREVYNLGPHHLKHRDDGEIWATLSRQKTDEDEGVPLLPPAIMLIEKYKTHPEATRRNRLFPVPTNQEYNLGLKEIIKILGIDGISLKTHKARFYFANEVTYNHGVPLKTVSRLLGHQSIKTTEIYVQANTRNLSESMKMVKEKLFEKEKEQHTTTPAPVIEINPSLKVVHTATK
ncbi:site-specific integrase [[Flexibacter] sp. ATCC 35208]|uniref:site-specific integrase n=1 Tax=[Flexibacter] sp. ATCC 35208 TaxID=1936242 RepID=UPI0009C7F4AE|nr:site-specific integrase [[Flexibacter] sp. ATCC 35208]OMP74969.1 hypothetical protein BW716_32620 [[Flexibacter] sp. ATCC 35208]